MNTFTFTDHAMMADALRLAWRGRFGAHPNPRVGCVIARGDRIVGRGWHERVGGPHAEVLALADAGDRAHGATAYVTLEPCSHHGRTPPCATALVEAGITRVVAAMQDPFPEVSGQGFAGLSAAGVDVSWGLLDAEARKLNAGYLSRVESGRPRVTLKVAASTDGATAMAGGESRWITSPASRRDVQRLRAASGAILTGIGTVLDDDPSLTVRDIEVPQQPLRVVLDGRLRMPAEARMLSLPGETTVYCTDDANRRSLETAGAGIVTVAADDGRVALDAVLADLAGRGVNDVLVECGPTLAGAFIARQLVDELVIYQAPHIMGSETRPMFSTPAVLALADRLALDIVDTRRVGPDLKIVARPLPARATED